MEMPDQKLKRLYDELQAEMHERILPFWMKKAADTINGGFFGRIRNDGRIVENSPKGAVLNARILWAFSAAFNLTGRSEYLEQARKAYDYFTRFFVDMEYGGVYWSLTSDGTPLNTRKQIYAQAFAVYALSEYSMTGAEQGALPLAIDLYKAIEKYAFDAENNGYIEALSREWKGLDDLRLSDKDANEPKSMNTHLHILEAYTKLYEVWKNDELGNRLQNLLKIHTEKIYASKTGHFNLFFDMHWNPKSGHYSFGHDIEGSWLIFEGARILGKPEYIEEAGKLAVIMAETTLREGIAEDGSLLYEGKAGQITDHNRHWWPQAEAVVGFINAFEISGDQKFLTAAVHAWDFIKSNMRHPSGEWFFLMNSKFEPDLNQDLAGEWKCPYHNTRCCIEIMKRVKIMTTAL
jgi:mannobiose 2-epimerase